MSPQTPEYKILLVANTSWYLYNFRRSLAERLRREGWEVVLVAPEDRYAEDLRNLGFRFVPWEVRNRGKNPWKEAMCLARLASIYRREEPTLVHQFTAKCVLYGTIASYVSGRFPVVNAVTGLGYVFSGRGVKERTLRWLVEWGFRVLFSQKMIRVIFQNSEDRALYIRRGLIDPERTHLIRGSGVDCSRFMPVDDSSDAGEKDRLRVLFASRMLRDKGVLELVRAGRITKDRGVKADYILAGDIYPDNPLSLSREEVETLSAEPFVEYVGHVEDMPGLLAASDIVVLPSYYREGTPRVLLEAAASGKPIIATDIPGCRGVVEDGINGYLVAPRCPESIARAVERLADRPDMRRRMGQKGREIVVNRFSDRIVLEATLQVYRDLLSSNES